MFRKQVEGGLKLVVCVHRKKEESCQHQMHVFLLCNILLQKIILLCLVFQRIKRACDVVGCVLKAHVLLDFMEGGEFMERISMDTKPINPRSCKHQTFKNGGQVSSLSLHACIHKFTLKTMGHVFNSLNFSLLLATRRKDYKYNHKYSSNIIFDQNSTTSHFMCILIHYFV